MDEGGWIDLAVAEQDFVMKVGAGGAAGAAHIGDQLVTRHAVADLGGQTAGMGVAGDIAVAMIDFHHIAITTLLSGKNHDASGNTVNISAFLTREIHTGMERRPTGKRVMTIPVG